MKIRTKPLVSVLLDTRYQTHDKTYLVTLKANYQVIRNNKKKWIDRYYPLDVNAPVRASEKDFKAASSSSTPRTLEQRELKQKIDNAQSRANKILDSHAVVTEFLFARLWSIGDLSTVGSIFNLIMAELLEAGRIGHRDLFRVVRNCIARFLDPTLPKMKTRKTKEDNIEVNISFYEIDKTWIDRFRVWLKNDGCSPATIAIYLRHLRVVYNRAIELGSANRDFYPFGKKGIKIKKTPARKIKLDEFYKNKLLSLRDPSLMFARDYWALSYYLYGLNMMDIALLKFKDLHDDVIVIKRKKTMESDSTGKILVIPVRDEVKEIIGRQGNKSLNPDEYIFPILRPGMTPSQTRTRTKVFTSKVNKALKKIKDVLELPVKLTTYTARHTFSNIALSKGASKEFIQDALGHTSMATTEDYLESFDISAKKAISDKL